MGLIFGDGLYSLLKIMYSVVQRLRMAQRLKQQLQEEPELTEAEYAEGELLQLVQHLVNSASILRMFASMTCSSCACQAA